MIAIKQNNKRSFQEIERIRDALNDSIYIFFIIMICFMIKYGYVVFHKDARVTQLPPLL